jgi:hypothetical protein
MFKGLVRHGNGGGSFKIAGWRDLPAGNQSPPPVRAFLFGTPSIARLAGKFQVRAEQCSALRHTFYFGKQFGRC